MSSDTSETPLDLTSLKAHPDLMDRVLVSTIGKLEAPASDTDLLSMIVQVRYPAVAAAAFAIITSSFGARAEPVLSPLTVPIATSLGVHPNWLQWESGTAPLPTIENLIVMSVD